jgi:hypothetical protein
MKVFVSSTCYDLVDLRAEVEAHLRDLGLVPLLSDRPSSEFEVLPDRNSIETCLANIRASDAFVCILSQRYGPLLDKVGYGKVSATHLEWREARKESKPIHMYVRDRTDGEASLYKANKASPPKLVWVKDPQLFELLEEHRTLCSTASSSNWTWAFRDSCELKSRLSIDLKSFSSRGMLLRWMAEGRLPIVSIDTGNRTATWHHSAPNTFSMSFAVLGEEAALSASVCYDGVNWTHIGNLQRTPRTPLTASFSRGPGEGVPVIRKLQVRYSTSVGAYPSGECRA